MNQKNYLPIVLVTIAVFTAWKVFGQQTKIAPAKPTWEYKTCILYADHDNKGWIERWEDGVSVGQPFSMYERIKELGMQGWELITVTPRSSSFHDGWTNYNHENARPETTPSYAGFTNYMYYYFKRMK